jgi:hypothetical protein
MMTHRRTWAVTLDGIEREIVVEYAALTGWMSVVVDGEQVARRWREWQTVWGGAEVTHDLDGHPLRAWVAQRFGTQTYQFALAVDGMVQPGSDDPPAPRDIRRATVVALAGIAIVVAVLSVARIVLM